MRQGNTLNKHMDEFTKLLADLASLDEKIADEDKVLLLLNSLPEEFEHFTMTLIHGKEKLSYEEVSSALVNHEYRRRDKESTKSPSGEALSAQRKRSHKGKKSDAAKHGDNKNRSKSQSRGRSLGRDECAFCHEKGHWKKDCPKLKDKSQKEKEPASNPNANYAQDEVHSDISLSVLGSSNIVYDDKSA